MGTKFVIYFLLYPLSLLPMSVLYGVGDIVYFFLYYIVKYRREVSQKNLSRSFPHLQEADRKKIEKQYYKHLSELVVEGVKLLSISREELMKRYVCKNPETINRFFDQNKSVVLLSSHYNNWEWMVLSLSMQFKHHGVGVGKENSNKSFEHIFNNFRTRYGTEVVFAKTFREKIEQYNHENKPCAYMMLCDQTPNNVKRSFIVEFLHQPTDMIYGGEYFAKKYDFPVFYYSVRKKKRGYYEFEIEPISENPIATGYGEIVNKYVALLERDIKTEPAYWLWSHRRWKHEKAIANILNVFEE